MIKIDGLSPEEQLRNAMNKAKYGWSKFGGPNRGLVQEDLTDEWNCQACGETQTKELPPFMYEFSPREYIRICSKCHNVRLRQEIEPLHFNLFISIVRVRHSSY